jgi:hypothetical protein
MPLATVQNAPAPAQDFIDLPSTFPSIPDDVKERFPSMADMDGELQIWYAQLSNSLADVTDSVSSATNTLYVSVLNFSTVQGTLASRITTETTNRIAADSVLTDLLITVSALSGSSSNITVSPTPPGSPALNDLWVNNTNIALPVTTFWNGTAWQAQTTPITVAAVAEERTARVTADGYLSTNYSITAVAGNIVTGMQINSSTGAGSPISTVIFEAAVFQIYDGTSAHYPVFATSPGVVLLAGTLQVNTSGKVFIGAGTYNDPATSFYVDSSGDFSLGSKLTWNGSVLGVNGTVVATAGYFGSSVNAVSITSAGLSVGNTGAIEGGQTAYNTGVGFWMGYQSGVYGFSIGNPATNYLTWDGVNLNMLGGVSPNEVIMNSTGLTVGAAGARSVVLGTYAGNAASFNFYNASNVDLMGMYLNGDHQAEFQQAVGNNTISIVTGNGAGTSAIEIYSGISGLPYVIFSLSDATAQLSWQAPLLTLTSAATVGVSLSNPTNNVLTCSGNFVSAGYGRFGSSNVNVANTTNGLSVCDASANSAVAVGQSVADSIGMVWNTGGYGSLYTFGGAFPLKYIASAHEFAGTMQFGTYSAGVIVPTGSITINDAGGTPRQIPCL